MSGLKSIHQLMVRSIWLISEAECQSKATEGLGDRELIKDLWFFKITLEIFHEVVDIDWDNRMVIDMLPNCTLNKRD